MQHNYNNILSQLVIELVSQNTTEIRTFSRMSACSLNCSRRGQLGQRYSTNCLYWFHEVRSRSTHLQSTGIHMHSYTRPFTSMYGCANVDTYPYPHAACKTLFDRVESMNSTDFVLCNGSYSLLSAVTMRHRMTTSAHDLFGNVLYTRSVWESAHAEIHEWENQHPRTRHAGQSA